MYHFAHTQAIVPLKTLFVQKWLLIGAFVFSFGSKTDSASNTYLPTYHLQPRSDKGHHPSQSSSCLSGNLIVVTKIWPIYDGPWVERAWACDTQLIKGDWQTFPTSVMQCAFYFKQINVEDNMEILVNSCRNRCLKSANFIQDRASNNSLFDALRSDYIVIGFKFAGSWRITCKRSSYWLRMGCMFKKIEMLGKADQKVTQAVVQSESIHVMRVSDYLITLE